MSHVNQAMTEGDRGCGIRLRKAREAAGLQQEEVAARLKMPLRVVQSLESEDWDRLGAPVFVRGQLRSYSRLLGLTTSTTIAASGVAPVEPPRLVPRTYTPRAQRLLELGTRRAIYIVITAAIAVPVWLATRPHVGTVAAPAVVPLDAPARPAVSLGRAPAAAAADADAGPRAPQTVVASLAPVQAKAAPGELELVLDGDSWVQVVGADGKVIEQSLLRAGDSRRYAAGQVGRVVVGNAGAVEVRRGGKAMDLAAFQRANVARFTVSSDGSLAPVSD